MITVTTRRTLGAGPTDPAQNIRAAQADLLDALPGVRLPDLGELRARGVLGAHPTALPSPRTDLAPAAPNDAMPECPDPG